MRSTRARFSAEVARVTGTPLIQVRNLSIQFTGGGQVTDAVRNVSFHIDKGEIVALVGESGSGKTASALSIMRLLPPAAAPPGGEILLRGQNLLALSEADLRKIQEFRCGSGWCWHAGLHR